MPEENTGEYFLNHGVGKVLIGLDNASGSIKEKNHKFNYINIINIYVLKIH